MSTQKLISTDIWAIGGSFHGSGANLTANTIPRNGLVNEVGNPGYIMVNDGSGIVSSTNYVGLAHGGTNTALTAGSVGTDNAVALLGGATAASLVRFSQSAVANSLVQRNVDGTVTNGTLVAPTVAGTQVADAVCKTLDGVTPVNIFTVPTTTNYVTLIDLNIIAITATGNHIMSTQFLWRGKNVAGTATADATYMSRSYWADTELAAATVTVTSASNANLYVTCVGVAATTVQWYGRLVVSHKSADVDT